MSFSIEIRPSAKKQLRKLPKDVQDRLAKKINSVANNPRPVGAVKLSAKEDLYRIREGDYRIVYAVYDNQLLVLVVRVGHRRDIYRS